MSAEDLEPPPPTLVARLRAIPVGQSRMFFLDDATPGTVRATLARIKADTICEFTTRLKPGGLRVYRLS